ncbi:MAG: SCO family protein [Deltaproteobacteria bacterium]|jgi:protein SCO1/2|nr:SCO family protein [Deltaproteobacteria bacterium]
MVLVVCAVALATGLSWFMSRENATSEAVVGSATREAVPEPPLEQGLTFVDHTGRAVSEADFFGRYLLVFFGYTHCPDVCPGGLTVLSAAMRELGTAGDAVQPVFITFDPARDTPQVLAEYVRHFHPRLTGLTGTQQEIVAAAKSYGVLFERDDDGLGTSDYSLRHSAMTYLIGPDGKGLKIFEYDSNASEMAAAVRALLESDPVQVATGDSS